MTHQEKMIHAAATSALTVMANPLAHHLIGDLAAAFKLEGRALNASAIMEAKNRIDAAFERDPAGAALALGPVLGKLIETAGALV